TNSRGTARAGPAPEGVSRVGEERQARYDHGALPIAGDGGDRQDAGAAGGGAAATVAVWEHRVAVEGTADPSAKARNLALHLRRTPRNGGEPRSSGEKIAAPRAAFIGVHARFV